METIAATVAGKRHRCKELVSWAIEVWGFERCEWGRSAGACVYTINLSLRRHPSSCQSISAQVSQYISSLIRRYAVLHANNSFRVCSRSVGGCCGDTRTAGMRAATVIGLGGVSAGTAVLLTRGRTGARGRAVPAAPAHRTRDDNDELRTSPIFINQAQSMDSDLTDDSIFHRRRAGVDLRLGVSVELNQWGDLDQRCTSQPRRTRTEPIFQFLPPSAVLYLHSTCSLDDALNWTSKLLW